MNKLFTRLLNNKAKYTLYEAGIPIYNTISQCVRYYYYKCILKCNSNTNVLLDIKS